MKCFSFSRLPPKSFAFSFFSLARRETHLLPQPYLHSNLISKLTHPSCVLNKQSTSMTLGDLRYIISHTKFVIFNPQLSPSLDSLFMNGTPIHLVSQPRGPHNFTSSPLHIQLINRFPPTKYLWNLPNFFPFPTVINQVQDTSIPWTGLFYNILLTAVSLGSTLVSLQFHTTLRFC